MLGGTGLVEAGTYIAILGGTLLAGVISVQASAVGVILIALVGYVSGRQVPPAPALEGGHVIDFNIFRSSYRLINATLHIPRLFLAIVAISFFWTIGAVLFIQFPPLVKNVLTADKAVASLFLAIFSVGVAIGSVAVNRLLKGEVSARYSTPAVLAMGLFVVAFHLVSRELDRRPRRHALRHRATSWTIPATGRCSARCSASRSSGGMFVVPLYAFLTTTVPKSQAARTVAANNIVNSGAMVVGSLIADRPVDRRGRGRGPAAARRRHVPDLRLARLEAAQGLRRRRAPRHRRPAADGVSVSRARSRRRPGRRSSRWRTA